MSTLSVIFNCSWNIALMAMIFLLPGCKRSTYKPRSLEAICPTYKTTQIQNNVSLSISPLTKKESQQLFDNRGNRLLSKRKPLHPVLITIKNESSESYTFDPSSIEFKLSHPHKVARRMYGHTSRHIITPLVLGSLGATICFFGAAYLVILGTIQQVAMPALVKAGYTLLGISGLVAIGTPVISYRQGAQSYALNTKIDDDICSKTIIEPVEIKPGSSSNFLVFIENRNCPLEWDIKLTNQERSMITFHLCVQKGGGTCIN